MVQKVMKTLKLYITEALHVNKDTKGDYYNYHPKTKKELKEVIEKLIKERGNKADLNDIDVSLIKDMTSVFYGSKFNGDISEWDVSNVTNMSYMFEFSQFNGDISEWDVSNVTNMSCMFQKSVFNGAISEWNVSNVENMIGMFHRSLLEKNPPKWYKK